MMTAIELVIAVAAIWRITHLLSEEDGPFDIIFLLRKKLGHGFFGNLLDCFYCLSIWIALPFALHISNQWPDLLINWLAFSGLASILQKLITKNNMPSKIN